MNVKKLLLVNLYFFTLFLSYGQDGANCNQSFTIEPDTICEKETFQFETASQHEMWFNFIAPSEEIVEIILDSAFVNDFLSEIVVYEFSNGSLNCNDTILFTALEPNNGSFELSNLITGEPYLFKIVLNTNSSDLDQLDLCLVRGCCSTSHNLVSGDVVLEPDAQSSVGPEYTFIYKVCEGSDFVLEYNMVDQCPNGPSSNVTQDGVTITPDPLSNPINLPSNQPVTTGAFTFTVTQNTEFVIISNDNSDYPCISNIIIEIEEVDISINGPNSTCEAIQTFTATSGFSNYDWTVSNNGVIINQTGNEITVDWGSSVGTSNTVTVSVVDSDTGCEGEFVLELDPCCIEEIQVEIVPNFSAICLGDNITLSSDPSPNTTTPITYFWSATPIDPSLAGQQLDPDVTVTPQVGTEYNLSITDANGCTASAIAVVFPQTFGGLPEIETPENACCTDQLYSVPDDYDSYFWSVTDGTIITGQGTNQIEIDWDEIGDGGTISLDVSDGVCDEIIEITVEGCCVRNDIDETQIFISTDYCGAVLMSDLGYEDGDVINSPNQFVLINTDVIVDVDLTAVMTTFLVAPGKKIDVVSGKTFLIRSCTFKSKCEEMWNGFHIEDQTAHLIIRNSEIFDAQNAVVSNDGGRFTIRVSEFINNYKGVVVNEFNGNHTGEVRGSLFTSVTGTLLPPHASTNSRSYIGMEINEVQNINVGVTNQNATNRFENLFIGIETNFSNANIVNNEFVDIIPQLALAFMPQWTLPTGMGIKSTGHRSLGELKFINGVPIFVFLPVFTTNVGGSNQNEQNYFSNCYKGIDTRNRIALNAIENDFDNIQTAGIFSQNAIFQSNSMISENNFNDCFHGVYYRFFGSSTIDIEENNFTNMKLWGLSFVPQLNRAIRTDNGSSNAVVNILDNEISLPERGIQAMGIASNGLTIENNSITYPVNFTNTDISSILGKFYRGISVEGCHGAVVNSNHVARSGNHYQGLGNVQDRFRGVFIANSADAHVIKNRIVSIGTGIYIDGSNPNSTFNCNTFGINYTGIDFNNATIGDQGANNQPNGNRWTLNVGPFRMDGNTVAVTSLSQWWHRPFGSTNPNPFNSDILTGVQFEPTNGNDGCINVVIGTFPFNPSARENLFGPIVRDERQFNAFNDAHRRWEMLYLQRHLRNDSDWLNMGTNDDIDYANFFNQNAQTCIGQLEEARVHIDSCAFDTATVVVNQVVPATIHEDNLKTAREIYLNTYAVGNFEFTPQQYNILADIACQYALEGGEGVYIARTLLGEDFDCGGVEQKSGTNDNPIKVEQKEEKIKIYPNPTRDLVTIEGMSENASIEVRNMSGQLLLTEKANSKNMTISLTHLAPGTYIVNILGAEGDLEERKKIVILR